MRMQTPPNSSSAKQMCVTICAVLLLLPSAQYLHRLYSCLFKRGQRQGYVCRLPRTLPLQNRCVLLYVPYCFYYRLLNTCIACTLVYSKGGNARAMYEEVLVCVRQLHKKPLTCGYRRFEE